MNFRPETWFDILAYLIVGVPAMIAAVGVILARRTQKDNYAEHLTQQAEATETADAVLYEVRNDHRTNLRDDIDALGRSIESGFHETRQDIRDLRQELCMERVERIEGDRRER